MNFFDTETYECEIDAKNKVVLRKLSHGQRKQAVSRSTKVNPVTQEVVMDYAVLTLEQLKLAVVSWHGPGFADRPVSPENIEAISGHIGKKIEQAMQEHDTAITGDDEVGKVSGEPTS